MTNSTFLLEEQLSRISWLTSFLSDELLIPVVGKRHPRLDFSFIYHTYRLTLALLYLFRANQFNFAGDTLHVVAQSLFELGTRRSGSL